MNNKRKYNRKQLGWGGAGSGAVSGAGTGAAFGPWGAVIGGVVGGVAGHFSEEQQKESEGQDNSIGQAASMTQSAIGIAGTLKGRGNISQQQGQIINPPPTSQPLVAQQVRINPNNPNQHLGTPIQYAMGGNTKLSEFNNGGTHEENPNGGIPIGQNASVEQGETKWEDYIFSDRIKVPGAKHTFADESKKIQKKYPKERENDVPTQKAKEKEMKRLMAAQEVIRTEMGLNDESQVAAYGGRIKYPDGGSLVSDKVLSVDSSGILPKTIYDVDKLSPKAKAAYLKNPELFSSSVGIGIAPGAPKMETAIDTNKDAIMKSLNSSRTPERTASSIPMQNLKWVDEPGITGWQQSKLNNKNVYRRVTMGADGKPTYGPIEYKMGGRIKAAYGIKDVNGLDLMPETDYSGLRVQDFNQRQFNRNPSAFEVTDPLAQGLVEEQAVRAADAENLQRNMVVPQEIATQTSRFAPEGNGVLARPLNNYTNSGMPNPSMGTASATVNTFIPPVLSGTNWNKPAGQGVLQNPPQSTNLESGYTNDTKTDTTDTGLGNTKQKGTSGFDKYDAITMGAQLLPAMYNIGQGLRKQKPVDLGRMTPNLVNYDSSRKASEDSFNQQANILNEGIRENATSSGQALSNRVAFANRAALDKANQLGQINEREFNTNQQIRGDADQVNLQIRANEEMIDAQNKGISQTSVGMGLAQIGQAAGTINRDRNLRNTENEMIDMLGDGTDFALVYDPKLGRRKRVHISTLTNKNTQV